MNFTNKTLSEKLYLGAFLVGVISLLLPWVDVGFASVNGFQQQGYLILIPMLYPVVTTFMGMNRNKVVNIVLQIIALVFMLYFMSTKSVDAGMFGTVDATGTGMYVMILANIGMVVGAFLERKY
ncbi:MAG: hypothetical protein ACRC30_04890 [Clostridium sp.]